MDWTDDMREAMRAIQMACAKNDSWTNCHEKCPFDVYCTVLMDAKLISPYSGAEFEAEIDCDGRGLGGTE